LSVTVRAEPGSPEGQLLADPFERWTALQLGCPARRARLEEAAEHAVWERIAERYDAESSLARAAPELVDWVAGLVRPEDDLLDVGAGTGAFALPLARRVRAVTAAEPSPGMLRVLTRKRDEAEATNLAVVRSGWEADSLEPHAVVLGVNSLYRVLDLRAWFDRVRRLARRRVVVILTDGRQPPVPESVLAALPPGRVPPVAGPAELEAALRTIVGPRGYRREEWRARREYAFASPADAVARLLGPFALTPDEERLAEEAIGARASLLLRSDHRVVGLTWSPPA